MCQSTETNHAEQNAKAWASSISEMVAALDCDYDRLEELRDELTDTENEAKDESGDQAERAKAIADLSDWLEANGAELAELEAAATIDGDKMKDADEARKRIEQSALSVEMRSGWESGAANFKAEEFKILLSTGGPALQIRGELDEHNQPCRAWLEYQDWGTPWTQYFDVEQSALLTFCSVFYFGE